jgi:hypothetical protein
LGVLQIRLDQEQSLVCRRLPEKYLAVK